MRKEDVLLSMKAKIFTVLASILLLGSLVFGQAPAKNSTVSFPKKDTSLNFMPLSEVKEGMKGNAWTVFQGTQPEEFNVEILGILPGAVGPKQDLIIGRISGGGANRTAVFAGMSGSPVYINGKLIGALSYSFPFSKEAICGITPIEQMIKIFEQKGSAAQKADNPRAVSFKELASTEWKPVFPRNSRVVSSVLAGADGQPQLNALAGQTFMPIATPVSFSGFSQEVLNQFAPQLMSVGLLPVSAAGGSSTLTPLKKADDKTLVGGTSVSMQLTRGDFSMAAAGTVTFRDGDKIYAFGHPFLSLGTADLPMSESHVITVVPSIANSFKMAVPDAMVGSMTQDRNTGVFGKLGQQPRMIPVKINMITSRNQQETFTFEVARDSFLTPILLNMTLANAISSYERGLGDSTISVDGEVSLKGEKPIKIERRFTGPFAMQFASGSVAMPVGTLFSSGFENFEISGINLNVTSMDGDKTAGLERISLDRTEVKAGESFEVQAYIRTNNGRTFVQRIPVKIPAGTPAGSLLVSVGDGNMVQRISSASQFVPKDIGELVKTINEVKKNDRLYVQTYRVTTGAIIGANELPNLPPSVMATLNNDRTAGAFKPTMLTVLTDQEVPPAEYVITGQQALAIEVIK